MGELLHSGSLKEKGISMESNNENAIEFLNGQQKATVSFCSRKYINRINALKEKNPEDVDILAVNEDGSIYAKVPISWIKVTPPRQIDLTEEQRAELAARLNANLRKQVSVNAE